MNLFIRVSCIYYDVYNNGECNLNPYIEDIKKYVLPFNDEFRMNFDTEDKKIIRSLKNKRILENVMNRVLELVKDEDLTYTIYEVYYNREKNIKQ